LGSWKDKLTDGRGFDQPSETSVLVSLHAVMRLDSIPNCGDDIMIEVLNLAGFASAAVVAKFATPRSRCNSPSSNTFRMSWKQPIYPTEKHRLLIQCHPNGFTQKPHLQASFAIFALMEQNLSAICC